MKNLKQFIIKAKKITYASDGEGEEKKLNDGSKELFFKEDEFFYRDRYFGFSPFIGEEVIFENKKPIWAMNYCGHCIDDIISEKEIYNFLQKALKKVNLKNIYRGPRELLNKNFYYKNKNYGNIESFYGEEEIYYKEELVYKLRYHGGLIKYLS